MGNLSPGIADLIQDGLEGQVPPLGKLPGKEVSVYDTAYGRLDVLRLTMEIWMLSRRYYVLLCYVSLVIAWAKATTHI